MCSTFHHCIVYNPKGVAPDIAAALKIILDYGKRTDFWHLVL